MEPEDEILAIRGALAAKVEAAGLRCFPTDISFVGREGFWAVVEPTKNTKDLIELAPIVAVQIEYLNFENLADNPNADADEDDSPVVRYLYQLTLFRSKSTKRLDESDTPDALKKRIEADDFQMELDIRKLCREFRGVQTLADLPEEIFTVRETNSLTQSDYVEKVTDSEFIEGVRGSQVKLICPVKIQFRECC